ncbi:MAG: FAD-binding oxidoreductase [Chloroflexota bacterium]|nr:FAD-binding oxidoreductase [Chloroflexota bacterium]
MTQQLTIDEAGIAELRGSFSGELLLPGDDGYEVARKIHNGMIDRRPALIARCLGASDIVEAVNFARSHNLEIAVRGGGHNAAGTAVCDDGMMIDLSLMKGVLVDRDRRTARAQGGVTWREFNRETQLHGLATTGGFISTTGLAGLTLGGGLGWLMSKYGLSVDNLLSVEIVTAAGEVVTASAAEHPDLFWGLRGGGGNFGVAASFEFQLHPVGPVVSGIAAHPLDKAVDVLRFFREFTANLPDELMMWSGLLHAPDGSGLPIAALVVCHCGSPTEAAAAVRPVKEFGAPIMDVIGPASYSATNMMLDDGFPKGAMNYWKSNFLSELSDAAIETLVDKFSTCPSPMSGIVLEHFHGAATRIGVTDTAFPHRQPGYNMLIVSEWMDGSETDMNIAWARETYAAMQPYMASGRYMNYIGAEGEDPVPEAYGPNYERLRSIKRKYDPTNLFHRNQNISPG